MPVLFKKIKKYQVKSPSPESRVPETGSDPPIGSGRDLGRDSIHYRETFFLAVNKIRAQFSRFSLFSHFLSLSRLPNTPLRMTTQRMVG